MIGRFFNQLTKAIKNGCVAVHCTHGINLTGFLLVSYLVEKYKMPLQAALYEFQSARGYKITNKLFLDALNQKYGEKVVEA